MTHSVPNMFCVLPPWCFSHVFPSYSKDRHPSFCLVEASGLSLKAQLKLPSLTFACPRPEGFPRSCGPQCSLFTLTGQLPRVQGNIFVILYVYLVLGQVLSFLKAEVTGHSSFFLTWPYFRIYLPSIYLERAEGTTKGPDLP